MSESSTDRELLLEIVRRLRRIEEHLGIPEKTYTWRIGDGNPPPGPRKQGPVVPPTPPGPKSEPLPGRLGPPLLGEGGPSKGKT
jgi:hypothetical protein